MASPVTIRNEATQFEKLHNVEDLCRLLRISSTEFHLQILHPKYNIYHIPKKNGSKRLIEEPVLKLKKIQQPLNDFFQKHYALRKPTPVHGFTIKWNDVEFGIKSNAQAHIGSDYMLNLDIKDFFHAVDVFKIQSLLHQQFSHWSEDLIDKIIKITTWQQRLPMGAPTSPILSNYACLDLDEEIDQYCRAANIRFSRYADDFTFSSQKELKQSDLQYFLDILHHYGFLENPIKTKFFKPEDTKIVTGVIITDTGLALPKTYIDQLTEEINRYTVVLAVNQRYQTGMSFKKLNLLKQELEGKLNFVNHILGYEHPEAKQITTHYIEQTQTRESFESIDWLEIPYQF